MAAVGLTLALLGSACGSGDDGGGASVDDGTTTTAVPSARTLRVPADHPTIQSAVDAAEPGDLVLVDRGTYRETVTVETPRLTIRGVDRNEVLIDGELVRENGIKVFSDGVAVENLTLHHHAANGVLFTGDYASDRPLVGFRISHVTAYANGLYGIYAFGATGGLIEQTHTAGHPDAGIYVGQCFPCDIVVSDSVAEANAAGFQGTNAGGDLYVVSSTFRGNRVGIESISSTKERAYPQRSATFVANRVTANDGVGAPRATDVFGVGIAIGGGRANRVARNVVGGHPTAGIVVSPKESFLPEANRVEANELDANAVDLVYLSEDGSPLANCFAANRFTTSDPPDIEQALSCTPSATGDDAGGSGSLVLGPPPPDVDWRTFPAPPAQPSMPDPDGPPRAVTGAPELDLDALAVPAP